jgi:hypothetical protein
MSLDHETESAMSGEGGSRVRPATPDARSLMSHEHRPGPMERGDSVLPNESASHHGDSPSQSALGGALLTPLEDLPIAFKFKAPNGRVHRLQVIASAGIEELIAGVASKLGSEIDAIGGAPTYEDGKLSKSGFALSYLDNEGDTVSITTHQDLIEAVNLARQAHQEKVDLFVHDPEAPALQATLDPQPAIAKPIDPPESVTRERKQFYDDAEEEARPRSSRHAATPAKQEDIIAGVPNDLLLPGALVTLAVVIVAVFALGRASSNK